MKDHEVIAHQARKLAQLERDLERAGSAEQQLLGILGRAGIQVFQEELTPDEVEFLDNYRRATPDGKAFIEEQTRRWSQSGAGKSEASPDSSEQGASAIGTGNEIKTPPRRGLSPPNDPPQDGLPRDFFRRS